MKAPCECWDFNSASQRCSKLEATISVEALGGEREGDPRCLVTKTFFDHLGAEINLRKGIGVFGTIGSLSKKGKYLVT